MSSFDLNATAASEITADDISNYLRATGWQETDVRNNFSSIWTARGSGAEIFAPKQAARDFDRQLTFLVKIISEFEEREPTQVLTDMKYSESDVVRVHIDTSPVERGTIGFEEAANVLSETRTILTAAARAAIRPNSFFVARPPTEASDYMATTRFGQTEPGSFTFTILSPVTPLRETLADNVRPNVPYARRVTKTLINALTGIRRAAEFSERSRESIFDDLVEDGVSANMCDSLAVIAQQSFDRSVEISFTWSGRIAAEEPRSTVIVPPTITSILPEMARHLKAVEPIDNYQILGKVERLSNQDSATGFDSAIKATIDGKERLVILELREDQRIIASTAWSTKQTVLAIGSLDKRTRPYTLLSPSQFELVDLQL